MYNISFHLKLYRIIYWTKKYSPKLRFHNKVIYKCKSDGCELVNQHCIWSKREGFVGLVKLNMTNRRAWHFIARHTNLKWNSFTSVGSCSTNLKSTFFKTFYSQRRCFYDDIILHDQLASLVHTYTTKFIWK